MILLLQCANDRRFISIIKDAIGQAGPNLGLKSVLEHLGNIINTGSVELRHNLLYKWSKPGANVLLWQQLKPEVLAELAVTQKEESEESQNG